MSLHVLNQQVQVGLLLVFSIHAVFCFPPADDSWVEADNTASAGLNPEDLKSNGFVLQSEPEAYATEGAEVIFSRDGGCFQNLAMEDCEWSSSSPAIHVLIDCDTACKLKNKANGQCLSSKPVVSGTDPDTNLPFYDNCDSTTNKWMWTVDSSSLGQLESNYKYEEKTLYLTVQSGNPRDKVFLYWLHEGNLSWDLWLKKPPVKVTVVKSQGWEKSPAGTFQFPPGKTEMEFSNTQVHTTETNTFNYRRSDSLSADFKFTGGGLFSPPTGFKLSAQYTSDQWAQQVKTSLSQIQEKTYTRFCEIPEGFDIGRTWEYRIQTESPTGEISDWTTAAVCTYGKLKENEVPPEPECPPGACLNHQCSAGKCDLTAKTHDKTEGPPAFVLHGQ